MCIIRSFRFRTRSLVVVSLSRRVDIPVKLHSLFCTMVDNLLGTRFTFTRKLGWTGDQFFRTWTPNFTKKTSWTEHQFTVTVSGGIRNGEDRVVEIVVRVLKRVKPDEWGWVQVREVWSTEEETHIRDGHFWISKFGTVPGSMNRPELPMTRKSTSGHVKPQSRSDTYSWVDVCLL